MRRVIEQRRQHLQARAHGLETVSPLATLARGYAMVTDAEGRLVTSYSQVDTGATIHTRLAKGKLVSVVTAGLDDSAT
jgi:exodeoxyribonuclease VII large subunit